LKLDQYIVKPLTSNKIHELLAKLNTRFVDDNLVELTIGVFIDKNKSTVSFGEVEHSLSKRELELLTILSQVKIINYDEINALWEDEVPTQNAVRSFIKYLRKKLPENLLKNRNAFGYAIENNL
jgi:DNA-binding response OmpR family regulator